MIMELNRGQGPQWAGRATEKNMGVYKLILFARLLTKYSVSGFTLVRMPTLLVSRLFIRKMKKCLK
jgi:hypothetical protein